MRGKICWLVPLPVLAACTAAWLVVSSPSAHGVVARVLLTTVVLAGGLALLTYRAGKRTVSHLKPPSLPTGSSDYDMEATDLDGSVVHFACVTGEDHMRSSGSWTSVR